jgi:hypothetical protein
MICTTLSDFLDEFFDTSYEYPEDDKLCDEGIVNKVLYDYVSNTYLNGFINYLGTLTIFLLSDSNAITDEEISEYSIDFESSHTDLSELATKILVLGETTKFYWILIYNPDNSDCAIGKFEKMCSRQAIEEILSTLIDVVRLPYRTKGWVSW